MKDIHRQRFAKLAIALYSGSRRHKGADRLIPPTERVLVFNMGTHSTINDGKGSQEDASPAKVHTCGTSCCFLGYAPVIFPSTRRMSWRKVEEWMIGKPSPIHVWQFLFGTEWPNSVKLAAVRALYLLQNYGPDKEVKFLPYNAQDPRLVDLMKLSKPRILKALQGYTK